MEDAWTVYTGEENFRHRDDVRRIRVAPHVTAIPDIAFFGCRGLREVDLSNVTEIGELAFEGCTELEEVDLRNVTEIGERALFYCTGLCKIALCNVKTIRPAAFSECSNLTAVELPEGLRTIGQNAFSYTGLKSVTIPSTVTEIGVFAFRSCTRLKEIDLSYVTEIGYGTFSCCEKLESVVVSSTVAEIRDGAFDHCTKLAAVEFLEGLQTIGQDAFQRCPLLERIAIPSPAFVVSAGGAGNTLRCQLSRDATISPDSARMVVSKHVGYMSPDRLEEAGRKINEILGMNRNEQWRAEDEQEDNFDDDEDDEEDNEDDDEDWQARIHQLFAYYELLDATTLLELAIWKAKMDQSIDRGDDEESSQTRARFESSSSRNQCRIDSGAHIILPLVVSYLGDLG